VVTKAEREVKKRKQAVVLYELLAGGMSDDEARDILGITEIQYENLKTHMWSVKADDLHKTTNEQIYLEYVTNQRACIADLDSTLRAAEKRSVTAEATVIKTKSDIYDKIIKVGQDFGFIAKKPEEKRIIGGLVITNLDNNELRMAIAKELGMATKLVSQHGEGGILDMDPGELHYSEATGPRALPEPTKPKMESLIPRGTTQKAKANSLHKGRYVEKKPTLG
jgi:hypothetical protein